MTLIDKIAWIETKDEKVLSTLSKGRTKYYLPGGKRESGETDKQALIREIEEELSVQLEPDSLTYLKTFQAQADSHATGVTVKMTCYAAKYTGTLQPAHEIEEIVWLTYQDREQVSAVDQLIFDWLLEQGSLR
ncbi:NUDIX domain-containing protein [Nibribacter koreensis]|uniref:NUDIX domain-containing protein n=1 Tax=Nibribacter koreensis TaxID=1084519 RepID=A0ABP8F9X1_9BACT